MFTLAALGFLAACATDEAPAWLQDDKVVVAAASEDA